jgi:hypothetical protein
MGQECREPGGDGADGHRGSGRPLREAVAGGLHPEDDAGNHQQQAEARGARCVVGIGHIDAHGRDGQAEGDENESLHGVDHSGVHARSVTEARPRVLTKG